MPKRADLSAALGRDAVYGDDAGKPVPAETRKPAPEPTSESSWEDRHTRVAFHCPVDVVEALEAERAASGRSKSRVIVDALREHLARQERKRSR